MTHLPLKRIDYRELNGRQKEIYNFQKFAAKLADYGFNCIKLDEDWLGADFLAYHKDGTKALRVQLKSRPIINRKYRCKDLYLCFPIGADWYLVPHDTLVGIAGTRHTLQTADWRGKGLYSWPNPPRWLLDVLASYRVE